MGFGSVFKAIFGLLGKVFKIAQQAGLTDELVAAAMPLVREAEEQFGDGPSRRAFVVKALKAAFPVLPEFVIRAALELAVGQFKREQ